MSTPRERKFARARLIAVLIKAGWSPPLPGDDGRYRAERALDDIREAEFPELPELPALSRRERDVLVGTIDGKTDVQMADELGLAVDTVRTYRRTMKAKLGATTVSQAVAVAFRRGLVS